MPPNTPAVFPPLVAEPIVTQNLCVVVVRLKRRVMDVRRPGPLEEEEAVVVDELVSAVESEEHGHVDALVVVDQLSTKSAN